MFEASRFRPTHRERFLVPSVVTDALVYEPDSWPYSIDNTQLRPDVPKIHPWTDCRRCGVTLRLNWCNFNSTPRKRHFKKKSDDRWAPYTCFCLIKSVLKHLSIKDSLIFENHLLLSKWFNPFLILFPLITHWKLIVHPNFAHLKEFKNQCKASWNQHWRIIWTQDFLIPEERNAPHPRRYYGLTFIRNLSSSTNCFGPHSTRSL